MSKRKASMNQGKKKFLNKSKHRETPELKPSQAHINFKSKAMIGFLLYAGIASAIYWKEGINLLQISALPEEGKPQSEPNSSTEIPVGKDVKSKRDENDVINRKELANAKKLQETQEQRKNKTNLKIKKKKSFKSNTKSVPEFQLHVQNSLRMTPVLSNNGQFSKSWEELIPKKQVNNSNVRVFIMDHFISQRECDGLIKAHDSHVTQHNKHQPIVCFSDAQTMRRYLRQAGMNWSEHVDEKDFLQETRCLNASLSTQLNGKVAWSYSTSFYPGESVYSRHYEERVQRYTGLDAENGGKFQVTSYEPGVGYKVHTDCTESRDLRDRFATILVYLQDVEEGGETEFIELGISVSPRKGRALVWNNMDANGNCDPSSLHRANPVVKGKKYILQRWYYYHNFPMLGKRSAPPVRPPREELTPRVTCDEFDSGSCRWYDEWNYDHLIR